MTGGLNNTVFSVITISDGEVNTDDSYRVDNDLVLATTSTVINYYTDVNGDENILYVTRNAQIFKIPLEDMSSGSKVVLPSRGPSNGAFPFVWDGKELFVYPYKGAGDANYLDGFAISEAGADVPLVIVPSTIAAPANGYQSNWVNAQVDEDGVTIYHYYPGGYINVWRLSKEGSSLRGDVDMDGTVGIADATALIDYILSSDATGLDLVAADCDLDGNVGIADATALIDYILNQSWD